MQICGMADEVKARLSEGEIVFVQFNNDGLVNALRLVPVGKGKYNEYWRQADNKGWILMLEKRDLDVQNMCVDCIKSIIPDEEMAIKYYGDYLKTKEEENA